MRISTRKNIQEFIFGGNMENKVIAKEYVDKNCKYAEKELTDQLY